MPHLSHRGSVSDLLACSGLEVLIRLVGFSRWRHMFKDLPTASFRPILFMLLRCRTDYQRPAARAEEAIYSLSHLQWKDSWFLFAGLLADLLLGLHWGGRSSCRPCGSDARPQDLGLVILMVLETWVCIATWLATSSVASYANSCLSLPEKRVRHRSVSSFRNSLPVDCPRPLLSLLDSGLNSDALDNVFLIRPTCCQFG